MGSLVNLSCTRCDSPTCCGDACARTIEEIQVDIIYPETTISHTVAVNGTLKQKKCWLPIKLGCCHIPVNRTGVTDDTVRQLLVEFDLPDADATHPGDKLVVTTCTPKSVLAMGTFAHSGTYYETQSWYWADERYVPATLEVFYKGVLHSIPLTPTGPTWTQAGVASRIQTALRALDSPPGTYPELATINVSVTMDPVEPSCTVLNDRTVEITQFHPVDPGIYFEHRVVLRGFMLVLEENNAPFTFADKGIKLSGVLYCYEEKNVPTSTTEYNSSRQTVALLSACCEGDAEIVFRSSELTYMPLACLTSIGGLPFDCIQPCDHDRDTPGDVPYVGQYCDSVPDNRIIIPEIRVKIVWADGGPCDIAIPAPFPIRVDSDFPDVKEQPKIDKVILSVGSTVITLDNNAVETPVVAEVVTDDWPPSNVTKKLRGSVCNLFGSTCYLDQHTRELKWAVSPNTNGVVVDGMFTLKFSDVNDHGVGLCVNNYFHYANVYAYIMTTASIVRGSPTFIASATVSRTCNLVSGSRSITSTSGNFAGLLIGTPVTGSGIPDGTVVTRWLTNTVVILSKPATLTTSTTITCGSAAVLSTGMQICQGGLFPIGAEVISVVGQTVTMSHAATKTFASGDTSVIRIQKLNSTLLAENAPQGWVASDFNDGDDVGIRAWAVDKDISNNTVSYSLTDDAGGRFDIDPATGVVTLVDHTLIDFATNAYHNITVQAASSDGSTSSTTFRIDVSDEHISDTNTNSNKITENSSTGTAVGITAFLSGSGVTYSFEENENAQGRFTINSSSGAITTATGINREIDEASYSVHVRATRADTTYELRWFRIMVVDVDEDDVTNAISLGSSSIVEGCGIGTVVGRLQGKFKFTNLNVDTDVHAVLTYSMTNGHSRFAITSEGTIYTVASIIRSEGSTWALSILVTSDDGSSANLSYSVTVIQSLSNSNAQYVPPATFTNISTGGDVVTVPESTSPGSIGLQVQVINSNHPFLKFTYSLYTPSGLGTFGDESINGNSLVSIHPTTGVVTLLSSVNGDYTPYVNIFIRATAEQNSSCETRIYGEPSYLMDQGRSYDTKNSVWVDGFSDGLVIGQSIKDWSQVADNVTTYSTGGGVNTIELEGFFRHREYLTLYIRELLLEIRVINGDYQIKWTCGYVVGRRLTAIVEATDTRTFDPTAPGPNTVVAYDYRKGSWQSSTFDGASPISYVQNVGGNYTSDWITLTELADLFDEITLPTGDWMVHSTGPTASLPLGGYTDPTDASRISSPIGFIENLPSFPGVYITPSIIKYIEYDVSVSTVALKIQLEEAP